MIFKSGQIVSALRKTGSPLWCVLVFGDDEGVVSDTAETLIDFWRSGKKSETRSITIDDDDIRREPSLLSERIETASLLGETDIIRVRTSGEKIAKPILSLVEAADLRDEPFANHLIIESSGLNKRSKLRTGIEAARLAGAVHVFADTVQSISDMIRARLEENRIEIEADALQDFVALLPGHRGLANQETEKLVLYGHGLGRSLTRRDIRTLSQTDAESNVRDMVGAALDGDAPRAIADLDRILEIGTSTISILRLFEMEAKRLLEARGLIGTGGDIGRKLKPPIWQNEWPAFRARMDRWTASSLTRLLAAIYDLELQAKTQGPAADAAIRVFILNVIKSASLRSRMSASR